MNLQELVQERNEHERYSAEWNRLNEMKNDLMLKTKPSTNEIILYFNTNELDFIQEGFTTPTETQLHKLYSINQTFEKRCNLEYNSDITKHPIPYILVRYENKYFFILRESGSSEIRLHGKKGCIGGHIGEEDKSNTLEETIKNGFMREAQEEIGLTDDMIISKELRVIIKSYANEVDIDHLGLVYEIEINTDKIKAEEQGVLTGIWINKEDIASHYNEFESWSQIIVDNLFKEGTKK